LFTLAWCSIRIWAHSRELFIAASIRGDRRLYSKCQGYGSSYLVLRVHVQARLDEHLHYLNSVVLGANVEEGVVIGVQNPLHLVGLLLLLEGLHDGLAELDLVGLHCFQQVCLHFVL
jgi:hypothetical protein